MSDNTPLTEAEVRFTCDQINGTVFLAWLGEDCEAALAVGHVDETTMLRALAAHSGRDLDELDADDVTHEWALFTPHESDRFAWDARAADNGTPNAVAITRWRA